MIENCGGYLKVYMQFAFFFLFFLASMYVKLVIPVTADRERQLDVKMDPSQNQGEKQKGEKKVNHQIRKAYCFVRHCSVLIQCCCL